MNVMNYYLLPEGNLDQKLFEIREWLFKYSHHERAQNIWFALNVAYCARHLEHDPFVDLVIETLC